MRERGSVRESRGEDYGRGETEVAWKNLREIE